MTNVCCIPMRLDRLHFDVVIYGTREKLRGTVGQLIEFWFISRAMLTCAKIGIVGPWFANSPPLDNASGRVFRWGTE